MVQSEAGSTISLSELELKPKESTEKSLIRFSVYLKVLALLFFKRQDRQGLLNLLTTIDKTRKEIVEYVYQLDSGKA